MFDIHFLSVHVMQKSVNRTMKHIKVKVQKDDLQTSNYNWLKK